MKDLTKNDDNDNYHFAAIINCYTNINTSFVLSIRLLYGSVE